MAVQERPLSPHLLIYKPQITSVLSIMHRLTGLWLGAAALALVTWLLAVANGPQTYAGFMTIAGSPIGLIVVASWVFCLFYHLLNGIRHLAWDAGWGFELDQVSLTGWTVVLLAIVFTIATLALGFSMSGGR